jgi:hypothetical protein
MDVGSFLDFRSSAGAYSKASGVPQMSDRPVVMILKTAWWFFALVSLSAADAAVPDRTFSSSPYGWSVSFPEDWKVADTDPKDIEIHSPDGRAQCGFHSYSGTFKYRTVDEFVDAREPAYEKVMKDAGGAIRNISKQRISLPNGVIGIDLLNDILNGGRSRSVFILDVPFAYNIDCETYAESWEMFEPTFSRIIATFTQRSRHLGDPAVTSRTFSNSTYRWTAAFPEDWKVEDANPAAVSIHSQEGQSLCTFVSGTYRYKSVDDFADAMQAFNGKAVRSKGMTLQSSARRRLQFPSGAVGIDVLNDILPGGKARRLFVLDGSNGYVIDCQGPVEEWEYFEPYFGRIIASFTLPEKP